MMVKRCNHPHIILHQTPDGDTDMTEPGYPPRTSTTAAHSIVVNRASVPDLKKLATLEVK